MLTVREQSRVIGAATYHVVPLPASKSLKVMARVLKMAAPSFGDVASLREAASAVGTLLSGVAADLDEDAIAFVCAELAAVTQVEREAGKRTPLAPIFDEHFRGDIVGLFEWLKFAAEVTYGPLGEWLRAQAPKPAAG